MAFEFAGQYGPELLLDPLTTRPLRSVAVSVLEDDGATLATLWTDRTKATSAANPTAADANGNLSFFADPGPKKISVGGVLLSVTVQVDPTEADTDGAGGVTQAELDAAVFGHATDPTAHPATDVTFTAGGTVASTNVQAALAEVAAEAVAAAALLVPLAEKGAVSGVAPLNASGKIPATHIPALALTETFVVGSQAAMLALSTAEIGDVAIRTDETKSYILSDLPPAILASWVLLLTPSSGDVSSVNGQTGAVVLPEDGAAGVASLRTLGAGASQAAAGNDSRLSNARTPTGAATGVLDGTYPSPGFAVDMATQAELDAHLTDGVDSHDASAISNVPHGSVAATTVQGALDEITDAFDGLSDRAIVTANTGAAYTVDQTAADVFVLTLTAALVAFTFSGAVANVPADFVIVLKQDGTGSRDVTWPASVKWPAGAKPILTPQANSIDMVSFLSTDGGTTWLGFLAGQGFA